MWSAKISACVMSRIEPSALWIEPFEPQCKTLLCDTRLYCTATDLKAPSQASWSLWVCLAPFQSNWYFWEMQVRSEWRCCCRHAQQLEIREEKRSLVTICNSIKIQAKISKHLQYKIKPNKCVSSLTLNSSQNSLLFFLIFRMKGNKSWPPTCGSLRWVLWSLSSSFSHSCWMTFQLNLN